MQSINYFFSSHYPQSLSRTLRHICTAISVLDPEIFWFRMCKLFLTKIIYIAYIATSSLTLCKRSVYGVGVKTVNGK